MSKEIYWRRALEKTESCIKNGKILPLKTTNITKQIYKKNDFIIRKLDSIKFSKNLNIGPVTNPFSPWDKDLEIASIGENHQLILNKYPVQKGHILLITNSWKPQEGWLEINDWSAIKEVNNDTSGLWFFNSGPLAGASQPHRHIQLLRRNVNQKSCPREEWFLKFDKNTKNKDKLIENIIVKKFDLNNNVKELYDTYINISKEIGIGDPLSDNSPKSPYNLLITNRWLSIIKRKSDFVHGFSINGLGFSGYILVTERCDTNFLKQNGPEKLLQCFV